MESISIVPKAILKIKNDFSPNTKKIFYKIPANICLFKIKNRNTRKGAKYVKSVFTVNFEYISHLVLVFLLWTLIR